MKKDAGFLVIYFILFPLFLSFLGIAVLPIEKFGPQVILVIISFSALLMGFHYGKRPQAFSFYGRYLPVYIPLLLTVLLAAIGMIISKGFFGHQVWGIFVFALFPFLPNSLISALMGEFILAFAVPFAYYLFFLIGFILSEQRTKTKVSLKKGNLFAGMSVIIMLLAVIGSIYIERSKHILPPSYGFDYGNGFSSVDLEPYYVTNPNNILPKLKDTASLRVETQSEMPILDGAEAAYPVYAAFANATYRDIKNKNSLPTGEEIVSFTNTIYAFERLVSGEVDIFFGAQPSASQQSLAESNGKELVLTPIGKEAFVFFLNEKNPVETLTSEEIKSIYSGKITYWNEVGGDDKKIMAFQRPTDSGSQTIMEKFMGATPLMPALREEVAGMGDLMEEVASYRNYNNSLGYSFRFFTTGMNPNEKIKLISLDGVEPTPENIASGKYPYVVNLYAITVKDNPKKTVKPMLKWMQGPEGQKLLEEIGYIPLHEEDAR
ncbi:substrate-binding domain-containing protein [Mesobacillus subterraneus]|uniref:substrate-binding domain-containing protein n=1 Tax=Mesobacillus subterraneus TaxID=285983 RepID=UPI001CFD8AE8|nr:substrate-binding domain-containing protein [Mesobacillus subterraneus]WLR57409.1 substrate-binding domain-containing protein [Mesobacillus subterraneus]